MTTLLPTTTNVTLAYIGADLLPISGGRYVIVDDTTIVLPVRYGYQVEVTYERGLDLYTVRRVFARGTKRTVKHEWPHVYADELGCIAYTASCFRD